METLIARAAPSSCLFMVLAFGCSSEWPASSGDAPAPAHLEIVPDAPTDEVPPVAWLRVVGAADEAVNADGLVLARGKLGPSSLADLAAGSPSEALAERIVLTTAFSDGGDVVVAPRAILADGVYSLADVSSSKTWPFEVRARDSNVLVRAWPPLGRSAASWVALYCGSAPLAAIDARVVLAPDGPAGRVVRGTPLGAAQRCVRFLADSPTSRTSSAAVHLPPAIGDAALRVFLDPAPLALDPGEPTPTDVVACEPGEIVFGPGCARVSDDRVRVRTPEAPVFWAIGGASIDEVRTTHHGAVFTVRGLSPSSDLAMTVETLGLEGVFVTDALVLHTAAPTAHAVLTEVYADAIGPEPASEWVELMNDGLAPLELDGWVLGDVGGETALPAVALAPGQIALVVGEDFVGDGEYDVAPAPDTLLVRVPRVGKNGLGNQGEPLKLTDPDGVVASRFPSEPKPRSGKSVARAPDAEDTDPSGFFVSDPPTPGSANVAPDGPALP